MATVQEANSNNLGKSFRFSTQSSRVNEPSGFEPLRLYCISARTWKALQGAYHHSERSTTASGKQEAHCLELCTFMMESMLGLPKLVQHLASYVEVFGTEVESDLTQS